MEQVINAFYMTMELWIFVAILMLALCVEEFVGYMRKRNEMHQLRIDAEIDRLHR